MTIEEIKALDIEALNQRVADIKVEMESEDSDIEALSAEVDAIEQRQMELKTAAKEAAEKRAAVAADQMAEVIEERKEEDVKINVECNGS